jgi:uroporphyrinogen-III synthase
VTTPLPGSGPLAGTRVLVPRAPEQAAALSDRVRALGGDPVEAPVLRIEEGDLAALRAALRDLAAGAFQLVCLTSPNGVAAVADALDEEGLDARVFAGVVTIACVGPGTAAALWDRLRLRPDLLPDRATTEALGEAVPAAHGRALLPRADIASPILPELLRGKGYEPVEVVAYRTGMPDGLPARVLDDLEAGAIDLLAFASPSTVRNFLELVGDRPWRGRVVSIGPVTSQACRAHDVPVAVEADPHDLEGLVDALVAAATTTC